MAAKVINRFRPDLVTAVSDCVHSVLDQCLAKGLIPDSAYKTILDSRENGENKARSLIQAVKNSIERDSSCFDLFISILKQEVPRCSRIIEQITRKEPTDCTSLVSVHNSSQTTPSTFSTAEELTVPINSVYGRLENAVRQHERACTEKAALKEELRSKEEENKKLKYELEILKARQGVDSENRLEQLQNAVDRSLACEKEVSELKEIMEKLESTIEDQDMLVKRGKSIISLGLKNWTQVARDIAEKKENEHLSSLRDMKKRLESAEEELLAANRKQEERIRELELAEEEKRKVEGELKENTFRHKIALQEKDLQIKDLQLNAQSRADDSEVHVQGTQPDKVDQSVSEYVVIESDELSSEESLGETDLIDSHRL